METIARKDVTIGMVVRSNKHQQMVMNKDIYNDALVVNTKGEIFHRTLPEKVSVVPTPSYSTWRKRLISDPRVLDHSFGMSIGTDPEIFATRLDGVMVPAFMFLSEKNKTKNEPQQFYDGFQAEWTTPPTACLQEQTNYVRQGMLAVKQQLNKFIPDAKLSLNSVMDIPRDMDFDPRFFQLGCSPSQNVYGDSPLQVDDSQRLPYRTAGWHMHMLASDYNAIDIKLTEKQVHAGIRMMDRVVGVGLVALGQGYHDPRRRIMYGRAGEFRWGKTVEYRVPDVLLGCHPAIWNLMFDLGRLAFCIGLKGLEFIWDAEDAEVQEVINKYDVAGAVRMLHRNEKLLRLMLQRIYATTSAENVAIHVLTNGINELLQRPTDIEWNWYLTRPGYNRVTRDWINVSKTFATKKE